jgi:GPH family glycoside/pentoside/hexuronide:cation symporter
MGSAGFNLMERLIVLYVPFYFLPPAEYGVPNLVPEHRFLGVATVLGMALVLGRIIDAFADPIIAALSDRSDSPVGRRKVFLYYSTLPLALCGALIFFPPFPGQTSTWNGVWLGIILAFFYIAYTGYVNPYLALISDLGHTEELRLKLSLRVAILGMIATLAVTAGIPEFVSWLGSSRGMELRTSYQLSVTIFAVSAALLLYIATLGFREKALPKHLHTEERGTWASLRDTFSNITFRTYVLGEMLLQFALNLMTMGLLYYIVVIFRRPQSFMTVLAGAMAALAAGVFPFVGRAALRFGKRNLFIVGLGVMIICSLTLFLLSFNMDGFMHYLGVMTLAFMGVPLAIFSILISPAIAQMARRHTIKTGISKEAMFFAARAIPVKFVIAAAGATFSYLLAAFGKDIARPLGVQLSLLVIALSSLASLLVFSRLPDDRVDG